MVKRWHYLHGDEYDIVMVEDPEGDYVEAEDYDTLSAEIAALREKLAAAEAAMRRFYAEPDEEMGKPPLPPAPGGERE